jgi:hypothetical protein
VLLLVLVPAAYSYVTTMLRPSSLPLGVRSVEWVRSNGGAWLVSDVERWYYSWRAPAKGGPGLTSLPTVAGVQTVASRRRAARARARQRTVAPARLAAVLHPALPGEGVWRGVTRRVDGAPPVMLAEYRPSPDYPRVVAYLAWIDHRHTRLALYPGRYEPPSAPVRGPMSVPSGQRWHLLATFNSGFTYGDGHGGFAVDGRTYEPLVPGEATLVAFRDGRVDVRSWAAGASPGPQVVLARQNLPLIVSGGRPNPALNDSSQWGATLGNAVRVWRSGIGVDRRGDLVYAAADSQTVGSLAAILLHAGAVRAMELDINAEWPTFIAYGRPGGRDPVLATPTGMQSSGRYLSPDDRDFFAVYAALPGTSATVPFR